MRGDSQIYLDNSHLSPSTSVQYVTRNTGTEMVIPFPTNWALSSQWWRSWQHAWGRQYATRMGQLHDWPQYLDHAKHEEWDKPPMLNKSNVEMTACPEVILCRWSSLQDSWRRAMLRHLLVTSEVAKKSLLLMELVKWVWESGCFDDDNETSDLKTWTSMASRLTKEKSKEEISAWNRRWSEITRGIDDKRGLDLTLSSSGRVVITC